MFHTPVTFGGSRLRVSLPELVKSARETNGRPRPYNGVKAVFNFGPDCTVVQNSKKSSSLTLCGAMSTIIINQAEKRTLSSSLIYPRSTPPPPQLFSSKEIHDLAAGSAFEVEAQTESTLLGRQSSVYGEAQARLVEAVPPVLARVRAAPADATTSEMRVEFEVLGTTGTLHYALSEAEAAAKGGQVIKEHAFRNGSFV